MFQSIVSNRRIWVLTLVGLALSAAGRVAADPPNGEWKTMYGVEIKQNSSSDPWVRIAKYDTQAGAETRITLMMRHGGQAAVRMVEFREFVPARILATPRVGKVFSPRIEDRFPMKTFPRTLPLQTTVDSSLTGKTIDAVGNRGIIIVGGRQVHRNVTLPITAIPVNEVPPQQPLPQPGPGPR